MEKVDIFSSFCKVGDIDHRMPSSVADGIPYVMTGDFFGLNGIDFDNAKKVSIEGYEALGKKIKPEYREDLTLPDAMWEYIESRPGWFPIVH